MAILNNNPLVGASGNQGGYNINNSLRFRSSASAYLSRTPASAGNRRAWTWSGWIKRGTLGATMYLFGASSTTGDVVRFLSTDDIQFYFNNGSNGDIRTSQVFRDPSAWYHLVFVCDTANATASNRMRIYVNGSLITAFQSATYPAQNYDTTFNTAVVHNIAGFSPYLDCYLADVNFIDGSAKTPSDFGETDTTTGVWKPKAYTGTYGTNGFYLKFSDIATTSGSNAGLGKDFSGNSNYWTTNNISVTSGTTYDAMTDSPTLTSATVANYCVLNPLVASTTATITNGNLNSTGSTTTFANARATFMLSSGKWYWEQTITGSSTLDIGIGLCTEASQKSSATNIRQTGWYNVINGSPGDVGSSANGGANISISTTNWATNDIIMVAYDADTGYIWFGRNGTWYPPTTGGTAGNPAAGTNQTISAVSNLIPASWHYNTNASTAVNFGQRPFSYTPPTGYVALNTYNLPTPTILQGNKYMDATLYTGTGSALTITNAGAFKPDLVWVKSRSNAYNNVLNDSVRGSTKLLISNGTDAEQTETQSITSFNSNGFSLGTAGTWNQNASTFVGWQWQAGQGSTSNITVNQYGSTPSIASTVSVSTTAGFSVVTYTGNGTAGATIGHGLDVAPKMIIVKNRSNAGNNWPVYVSVLGNTGALFLSATAAFDVASAYWNNTSPTSTVFSVGSSAGMNGSTQTYVAYCWAEIAGFSKIGSYTGNGSTDGPFIYTGFRPKFILYKASGSAESWMIYDTSRNPYNVTNLALAPQSSSAEFETASINRAMDILSNGFKPRGSDGNINSSGATYIYAAFAENPFKNALAR